MHLVGAWLCPKDLHLPAPRDLADERAQFPTHVLDSSTLHDSQQPSAFGVRWVLALDAQRNQIEAERLKQWLAEYDL